MPNEELPEASAEPTMMSVRSEGFKLDLVLLRSRVSGLTIDYQDISESKELHRWLKIIDGMLSGSAPSPEGAIPEVPGEATRLAPQPLYPKTPEERLQENADPTMIKVRSKGLKLDLVLLQNRVSGLTIDYQNISNSGELQRWIRIIDSMFSGPVPSPERAIPKIPVEAATPPASQPQSPKVEQEAPPKEKEEQETTPKEIDYHKVVLRAVDVSLDTLGRDKKHAVLSLLEDEYGIKENDIPDHPEALVEVLDALIGPSAQSLEREIMNNIRLVWAAPGENLETVVKSLKEQTREASDTT